MVPAREIENPAAADTSGYVYTRAGLVVDHEYLRNVLLQGRLGVQVAQYLQGGGTQTSFSTGARINWLINRNMSLLANYDFSTQGGGTSSAVSGQPNLTTLNIRKSTRNMFLVGIRFAL